MYPTFEAVKKLAESGLYRRIPVYRELYADRYTPVEVMRRLRKASRHCYLLESAGQSEVWGRYSFLGCHPTMEITCTDGEMTIREKKENQEEDVTVKKVSHPGDTLREILAQYKSPVMEGMPPFTGGLVGYFSYDYIKYNEPKLKLTKEEREEDLEKIEEIKEKAEKIKEKTEEMEEREDIKEREGTSRKEENAGVKEKQKKEPKPQDFRDMDLMLFDQVIAFDHYKQKVLLITGVMTDNLEASYQKAQETLEEMKQLIQCGEPMEFTPLKLKSEILPQFPRERYCSMVEKAKQYIREGDIFQVVLSNPMRAQAEGNLFDTYRVLRATNPSPYMFYFSSDDLEMAGASPETLVKLEAGKLSTFPLAGTRPRGKTRKEDLELEADLLQDEKELAEHNMLVDLGRNDIGKISQIGSVEVEKYLCVERFSHVMHLGSTVIGELERGKDAVDAVDAILPAGTLSGAPKFRACQIIAELENSKRGVYGGAIGYLDFTGNLDTCIAIRLVYKKNDAICIRSGAGIVADSVPDKEFDECCNKARAVVQAIQYAGEGLE